MMAKIDVNGPSAHPLYAYLKHAKKGLLGSEAIKWNFTKFLVDRQGEAVGRFAPLDKPEALSSAIEAAALMADAFDVVVIGAGPGGYVAAIRASQLGLEHRHRRAREPRRHLPELGLHPDQGAPEDRRDLRHARPSGRLRPVGEGARATTSAR